MTRSEIFTMILDMGFPAAYNHFPDKTEQAPPFVCFYYPASSDTIADDTNYVKIEQLYIELYTDEKDFAAESAVEAKLRKNCLPYARSETWLDTEKMFLNLYTMEVIIDPDNDDPEEDNND